LAVIAFGGVHARVGTLAVHAYFKQCANYRLVGAAFPRIASVTRARVAVVADRRISVAGLNGTVLNALPVGIALALIRPDARAMAVAVSQISAMKNGTRNRSDAFPARFANAGIWTDTGAIVAIPDVATMELVAVFALPAAFTKAQPAESTTGAVLAPTVILSVAIGIIVDQIRNAIAIVVVVLCFQKPIGVDVVVKAIRLPVSIDVVIVGVARPVLVNIGVFTICDTVAVNVRPVLRVKGIAATS
jgi:hypothetical protein